MNSAVTAGLIGFGFLAGLFILIVGLGLSAILMTFSFIVQHWMELSKPIKGLVFFSAALVGLVLKGILFPQ
jgi:hypothetical protein